MLNVLSNLYKDDHDNFIQREEFKNIFTQCDDVMFSFQEGTVKPDLAMYKKLLEKYKLKPEECFYMGKKKRNIEAGKKLDIDGLVYADSQRALEELKQRKIL